MLNSAEHNSAEHVFSAYKCLNANNCWQLNMYEREKSIIGLPEPEQSEFLDIFILTSI